MPTDEHLCLRGCIIVSICCLCGSSEETSSHLFLSCPFATSLWSWLAVRLNLKVNHDSIASLLSLCDRSASTQLHDVRLASIVHVISTIWFCRNQARFNNRFVSFPLAISIASANISFSGNLCTGTMRSCTNELTVLRSLDIKGHAARAPRIIQVDWYPPLCTWVKCNTDGAARGQPGHASCGGIFRDHRASFLGAFAEYIGISSSFHTELFAAMMAITFAYRKGWHKHWWWLPSTPPTWSLGSFEIAGRIVYISFSKWNFVSPTFIGKGTFVQTDLLLLGYLVSVFLGGILPLVLFR